MIEKVRFRDFKLNKNHLILSCEEIENKNKIEYPIKIESGCICPDIRTFDGNLVSINFLEKDDIIHLKILNDEIVLISLQQKYDIYSDSDSDNILNTI